MTINQLLKTTLLMLSINNIAQAEQSIAWQDYTVKHKSGEQVKTAKGQVAYFDVPARRDINNDQLLKLGFVRLPSTAEKPGNPIVYLSGGPGGSATGTAQGPRFDLFVEMTKVADVILFDQRGTGLSRNGLENCNYPSTIPMTQAYTKALVLKEIAASSQYCAKQWQQQGVDLNAYNTLESAADLEALRKVLKAQKLDIWGISYGTHLALTTAKYFPETIGRMVLASSEGLDHTVKLPARADEQIKRIANELRKDPVAAKKYPDLSGLMARVFKQLREQPALIEVKDPRSGEVSKLAVGELELQMLTAYFMTRDPQNIERLPATFAMIANGDFSMVGRYFAYLRSSMWQMNPMSAAMDGASGISKARWQQVKKQSETALLWRTHNLPYPDANAYLGVDDLGEAFRKPFSSKIPTLFLAGTLDGRTFVDTQQEIAQQFSNSAFVSVERGGHNLFLSSPEVLTTMMAFYRQQKVVDGTITLPMLNFL